VTNFPQFDGPSSGGPPPVQEWRPAPLSGHYPPDPPRISPAGAERWPTRLEPPDRILASGWMNNGPEVDAFEREFAAYLGVEEAVAVSSGATGVELALRTLRLPGGSRVLISTLAPCSVLQAVLRAALRPVLLDVSADTGMPTEEHLRQAIRPGTGPVRALVVGHWAGNPSDVSALADAAGVPAYAVVEDAEQALGAWRRGQRIGGAGSACFSFYATANLPVGEGGMVATDDADRARFLRHSREHGISPAARRHVRSGHVGPHVLREGGLQSGLSEQSAATGRDQLQRLVGRQLRRQGLARRYDERLAGIPGVALPHRPAPGTGEHAWQLYPARIERPRSERDAVVRALASAGVGTMAPLLPMHQIPFCRETCELPEGGFPGAETIVDQLVSLPIYPRIADAVVDRVSDVFQATLGRRRTS
jgi:dTDP-4-amino-4,6-dideoxygalactose transaminase